MSVGKFRLLYCPFQMSCGSPLHAIVGRIKSTLSCEILDQSAKSEVSLKYPLVFVQRSAVNHLSHYICIWMQKIISKAEQGSPPCKYYIGNQGILREIKNNNLRISRPSLYPSSAYSPTGLIQHVIEENRLYS